MDTQLCFKGSDGLDKKIRMIAGRCAGAARGFPRTMVVAVTLPDPEVTPDCQHEDPRAVWVNQFDTRMTPNAVASLLGAMQSVIDFLEDGYYEEFGPEIREGFDDVRARMHGLRANTVAMEPLAARSWSES